MLKAKKLISRTNGTKKAARRSRPFISSNPHLHPLGFGGSADQCRWMIMVNAVKWVDEVIPDAPYAITEEFMNKLFDEYKIDYIIHGDDPCLLPDGSDAYALAKKAGQYKQIKRTEGVSSMEVVGLQVRHGYHISCLHLEGLYNSPTGPGPDARIVHIDGAFDLFHAGNVEGDYKRGTCRLYVLTTGGSFQIHA
ncbi:ethanolamine-phosphate cytidylyltransferase-like isoform X2 [Nymphaea colorata]|uniref:ethanolamine-phosphate cytidylyltransferase-like isoform X2 n=1 Tax=Nymphaea colorata TaxID=210225 RepID=UPI00214DF5C7|nr:ethanolamine-phosphate cytidylyltransferase-like isoform X2 [Nymphaea colorata]